MKRLVSTICVLALVMVCFALPVSAQQVSQVVDIEYLEDGSTIEYTITEAVTPGFMPFATSYSKTGNKEAIKKDSSGNKIATVKVTGSFTYNGSSATCTSSSVTVTIHNSAYTKESQSATKSGNSATASAVVKRTVLGFPERQNVSVTLFCDKNGVLS